MKDFSTFIGSSFILLNMLWKRPVEEQYPHSSVLLYCHFIRSSRRLLSQKVSFFFLLRKINVDAFIVSGVTRLFEAEQMGNVETKAQSAHSACVSLSGCWLGSGNMAQLTFAIFRGTCKMCRERVGSPTFFFSDVTPLHFISARVSFNNAFKACDY